MGEAGAFHEVSHPCERADEGSLGQHLGSLSFSTVGQSRTAGKLPAQKHQPCYKWFKGKGSGETMGRAKSSMTCRTTDRTRMQFPRASLQHCRARAYGARAAVRIDCYGLMSLGSFPPEMLSKPCSCVFSSASTGAQLVPWGVGSRSHTSRKQIPEK